MLILKVFTVIWSITNFFIATMLYALGFYYLIYSAVRIITFTGSNFVYRGVMERDRALFIAKLFLVKINNLIAIIEAHPHSERSAVNQTVNNHIFFKRIH